MLESTLADTVILAAYTEGYITTSEQTAPNGAPRPTGAIPCPYEVGTREFDLWVLGYTHRRLLKPDLEHKEPGTCLAVIDY